MMAGLIAYLPKCPSVSREALRERGLGDLLDSSVDPVPVATTKGPDGGAGMLVTFCGAIPLPPPAYDAVTQEWLEAPADGEQQRGRYWLGYVKTAKPTAHDLQRGTLIDGEPVLLADGQQWIVPCCEYAPKRLTRDTETGRETKVVASDHKLWVDWSNALFQTFVSNSFQVLVEKDRVVQIPNGLGYAALCLTKNYRVNMDAIDLLQLVGEYEAFEIARVATGMSIVERIAGQKKTAPSSLVAAMN